MSTRTLYRLSGVILLLGGVLAIIGHLLQIPSDPGTSLWVPGTWLALGGSLLVGLGWPGIYLRQAAQAGRLGLVGFVLAFLALLIVVGIGTFDAFVSPVLASSASTRPLADGEAIPALLGFLVLAALLQIVGPLLFGIATLRARVFPRWIGIMLMVGAVAQLVTFLLHNWNDISDIIYFLAIACFGFVLWSVREGRGAEDSAPVLGEDRS